MAEGVFMYLDGKDVRSLVLKIQETFPGSELVCEVVNSLWLSPLLKKMLDYKTAAAVPPGKGCHVPVRYPRQPGDGTMA